jgi:predicted TIM-barrel fold metal-dependent hydrolase
MTRGSSIIVSPHAASIPYDNYHQFVEIVDAQVHIPRLVTDGRPGHARAGEADAPVWDAPGLPPFESPERDVILTATLTGMDAAGVNALVIDEWIGHNEQGRSQPGHPVGDGGYRWSFDFSQYAAERYPERFSFLARAHPFDPEVEDVVARLASVPGMRCLRVDPMPWLDEIDAFRDGKYATVFAAALRHDLPVFVWSNGRFLPNLEQYLRQFPDLQFVIDHMGTSNPAAEATGRDRFGDFDTLFALGRDYENLGVKWSTVESGSAEVYPYRDMFPYLLRALEVFGRERVLWASDWSEHKLQHSWAQSFLWILESDELSTSDKEWLLGRSTRTLLRWPAVGAEVGSGLYLDCANAHPTIRVSGADDDEFLANMRAHLARWHPHHQATREQLLARARR